MEVTYKNNEITIDLDKLSYTDTSDIQSLIDTAKQSLVYDILTDIYNLNNKQLDKAKLASINHAIALDTRDLLREHKQEQLVYMNGILEGIGMVQNLILKSYNRNMI